MADDGPDLEALAGAKHALGNRMAQIRKEANMSQTKAALRAGMTRRNWCRIENGELNPRLDSLLRIQSALGRDTLDSLLAPTTGDLLQKDGRWGASSS
jgi:transcriptional regulator with XRE-family HTH domain